MDDVCANAVQRGLAGITFTDHFDTHPSEWPNCLYDYDAQRERIALLRARYAGTLRIGHGIEVCYQPDRIGQILDHLARFDLDLVLLSVHWMQGRRVHERDDWGSLSCEEGTRQYLLAVRDAARFCAAEARFGRRPFDILGHMDFVSRYTRSWWGRSALGDHAELVDEILRACLEAELIPEINTSPLRNGVTDPMPPAWVARRYAELGGTCMSIGSDAHRAEQIGAGLDTAAQIVRDAGMKGLAVFERRQCRIEPFEIA
jgi:histidinol-phosphatase (PHP family)